MKQLLLIIVFFGALSSCKKNEQPLDIEPFTLLDNTGIDFENTVKDLPDFNILSYRNYYNGGGVAIGDINNDGLNDVYFTANMANNTLYLNKGQMQFENITQQAGVAGKKAWCTGVTMADVNADGWLDIYLCYSGDAANENKENELWVNNHNNTFTERAKEYGLNDAGLSTHATFFDYDLDGDLDCYVLNNSYKNPEKISLSPREQFDPTALGGDRLYRNDGPLTPKGGGFVNVTQHAGLYSNDGGFGLGISVGDVNGDLYPDVFISNDFWERDYLYINQKNGKFLETLTNAMSYTSLASMGSDMADINNDGLLDIFSTDMLPSDNNRLKAAMKFDDYYLYDMKVRQNYHHQYTQNCLHINQGDGVFVESAFQANVAATDWSWGALIFDMNLDGKKDIFVSNGVYHDITDLDFVDFIADKDQVKQLVSEKGRYDFRDFVEFLPHNKRRNYAFLNQGGMSFSNVASQMNLDQEGFSNGSAYGDLDNDGDLDLVVNNVNMKAFVYKNNATNNKENHYIKCSFKGGQANTFGIGATVWLYQQGQMQMVHNLTARGFQSSVAPQITFGLGKNAVIDSLRVVWPNHRTELIRKPKADQTLRLDYAKATQKYVPKINNSTPIFAETPLTAAVHTENGYIDYDSDRLMPHVLSTEGPKLIKGDVNKDGHEDFILQGAKDMPDKLFLNNGSTFAESKQPDFEANKKTESTSGALFDADTDGDLDYLVGLGGNEARGGIASFTAIYYENDGKGNFKKNQNKGPKIIGQIGCIKPFDFDGDGDIDLFAGGKAIPGHYGLTPRSFLLRNDGGGIWDDITNQYTGPIGMVTDAAWSDVNNDKLADLIVVGEWMPITIFINNRGRFDEPLTVPNSEGWWNTIEVTDIDQDGDSDYLLGNWGTNIKLKASTEKPLSLYVQDFDDNTHPEVIMEWFTQEDETPYPFASKGDLTAQMPILKKKILKYQDFAKMQVSDLFDGDKLAKAIKRRVVNFHSSVLLNQNGNLVLESLQEEAQRSPIFAFEVGDFDKDGKPDYYAGGNFYRLKPEIGKHDGFYGGYFKGMGKGKFSFMPPQASGLHIKGEVRDAITIDNKLLIGRNNASVLSFKQK